MVTNNMRIKKICMVVLSYYPDDPRVRREAEALNDNGYHIDILCLRHDTEEKVFSSKNITAYRILNGTENKENILRYIFFSLLFFIVAFIRLQKLSIKHKYKIIQFHNMPDYLVFVGIIHKLLGIPIILDLHDLSVELFASKWKGIKSLIFIPFVKFVEKLSCKFSTRLITTSPGFQQRLIERGIQSDKISLIMNTADDKIFTPSKNRIWIKKNSNPKIIYHGTVARRFGIHVAIEAIKILSHDFPKIQFFVYGKYDPQYKNELLELISKNELSNNVSLNGYLSLEKIVNVIQNADMGIVPYLSDGFMDIALSTKTFEYIKMECPVIASKLPSLTALFDDSSIWYFNSGSSKEISNNIISVYNNPLEAKEKVKNALITYKKFSWEIMTNEYLKLVRDII